MAGFVRLPPSKFLQLCVCKLGICELAENGPPISTLLTFEGRKSESPRKNVNMQAEAEGVSF